MVSRTRTLDACLLGARRRLTVVAVGLLSVGIPIVVQARMTAAGAVGGVLVVDQANASCSDKGAAGTPVQPFCTIGAAAAKATAGTMVSVNSGTYTESVAVKNSGTADAPIVFTAAPGATVVVTGQANGFVVSGRSWVTIQGFTVTQTSSIGISVSSSTNVSVLGNHVTYAGHPVSGQTAQGIRLGAVTGATVAGNTSDHNSEAGILIYNGSTGVLVSGNTTFANARGYTRAAPGIDVRSSGNTVAANVSHDNEDSGLQFYTGGGGNVVVDNVSYHNGDHGIDDLDAPGQVIVGNTVYGNVAAGINLEGSSSGGQLANNISVDNGVNSPRTSSNIRLDSQSITGASLDSDLVFLSPAGTVLFIWGTTSYSSLAAFRAATGQEPTGLQGDPRWSAPGAGDFRLTAGSPAIDSANAGASGQPSVDFAGNARYDDLGTPNTGIGSPPYSDRGALEFQGTTPEVPPTAALTVTPATGTAPLAVTADASASSDGDATPIATYSFDFGDGTVTGAQAAKTAKHTYSSAGLFTVTVTVVDTAGNTASTSTTVSVNPSTTTTTTTVPPTTTTTVPTTTTTTVPPTTTTTVPPTTTTVPPPPNLVGNPGFETNTTGWGTVGTGVTLQRGAGGRSGLWSGLLTNGGSAAVEVTLNDSPNWVKTTGSATYTVSAWVRSDTAGGTIKLKVREYVGSTLVASQLTQLMLSTTWQQIRLTYVPVSPGSSTLDLNTYESNTPVGGSFSVDDVSITLG